jgi:hypothetical protein
MASALSNKMSSMTAADGPLIQCHPPERRRRADIRMCHGSCCCCCCLHTVGGIIGAAVAPSVGAHDPIPLTHYYDEVDDIAVPNIAKTGVSAVRLFWLLSLAAAIVGALIGAVAGGENLVVGLVILALVFPGVQLVCALIALFWLGTSARSDRSFQLKQGGKILLGLVLGTMAGILVMVAIGAMMSH